MKYNKFEDTPVWQKSRAFTSSIYFLVNNNNYIKKDYSLSDQLKRATVSIMLNIAEGFERGSNKDFAHFMDIAKGSAGEVRSILYILLDNKYIEVQKFEKIKIDIEDISAQLSSLKRYLVTNEFKKKS